MEKLSWVHVAIIFEVIVFILALIALLIPNTKDLRVRAGAVQIEATSPRNVKPAELSQEPPPLNRICAVRPWLRGRCSACAGAVHVEREQTAQDFVVRCLRLIIGPQGSDEVRPPGAAQKIPTMRVLFLDSWVGSTSGNISELSASSRRRISPSDVSGW